MALKQHVSLELSHFHVQIFTAPKTDKMNLKLAPKEWKKFDLFSEINVSEFLLVV